MRKENKLVFSICSILLEYPNDELINLIPEIEKVLNYLPGKAKDYIKNFIDYVKSKDLIEIQKEYVSTFDLNAGNSLHLSYHIYRDEPERGAELYYLKQAYMSEGFLIEKSEFADYLPLILEFLGLVNTDHDKLLFKFIPVLKKLADNLEKLGSKYYFIMKACLETILG
jgi:nitrate reductase delta subunit